MDFIIVLLLVFVIVSLARHFIARPEPYDDF